MLMLRPDLMLIEEAGETILFDPASGEISLLNVSASLLVGLLDGKHDIEQLAQRLVSHFEGIQYDEALSDVTVFVANMRLNQFLV